MPESRRRPLLALPGVEADVVTTTACTKEGSCVAVALCHLEPQQIAVKADGRLQIDDLQVNMF